MDLSNSINTVPQVGKQRSLKLQTLGVFTVEDMLLYFPREYKDRSTITTINNLILEEENTLCGIVACSPENIKLGKLLMTKMKIKDKTGTAFVTWYGQSYLKKQFSPGESYLFTGKVQKKYDKIQIQSPEYEKLQQEEYLSGGRIVPLYSSTYKLSQKFLRQTIKTVLNEVGQELRDILPHWLRNKYNLSDYTYAIFNIHFPQSNESFFIARRRLVFEELFFMQIGLMQIKNKLLSQNKGISFHEVDELQDLISSLPFDLTEAQIKVWYEIKKDMMGMHSMNRLIQGDVGSGKTVLALISMFYAVKNGYQCCMMAPTEVLARQHYESGETIFKHFDISIAILTGSMTKKQKEKVLYDLQEGSIQILLGTHAVIQESVVFHKLGLVITDEQHRFGVRQRSLLSQKGMFPDTLIMTATPIPRTLALILYGDLDVSIINQMPPGRQKIHTYAVPTSYRERVYAFIKKQIQEGRQSYIICPAVEESDTLEIESVMEYTSKIKEESFASYEVQFLHGKMKPKEKLLVMDQFAHGEIQVLVSTTVVEVGVNVPNATIILIENAERFGLAQLHQLRGRVGRGSHQSYCILMTDSQNKVTAERMKVLTHTNNGFEISEMDLKLRGPGEFFGIRQHGLPELKIADLYKDFTIIQEVQEACLEILETDPCLEKNEHAFLRNKIQNLFYKDMHALPL